jgi:methionine aminopeptidase
MKSWNKHITLALIFPKRDRKLSAQFEHTIAVTEDGVEILTLRQGKM